MDKTKWAVVDEDTLNQVPFQSGKCRIPLNSSIANDETFSNINGIELLAGRQACT